uniref:Uncharacterized protein AlNc14C34G3097 n=1 Tax=Albugo laibachii Nc14 TaxID=890382 RepID=F0W8G7_9STRA|nr:conserved hypothetical protein [Albugo laibachii Nc14]|eukprot:CCA17422.1 conserved hypothetical protein [Albugo laibachii Nc14]
MESTNSNNSLELQKKALDTLISNIEQIEVKYNRINSVLPSHAVMGNSTKNLGVVANDHDSVPDITYIVESKDLELESTSFSYDEYIPIVDSSQVVDELEIITDLTIERQVIQQDHRETWLQKLAESLAEDCKIDESTPFFLGWKDTMSSLVANKAVTSLFPNPLLLTSSGNQPSQSERRSISFADEIGYAMTEDIRDWSISSVLPYTTHQAMPRLACLSAYRFRQNPESDVIVEAIASFIWRSRLKFESRRAIYEHFDIPEIDANDVVQTVAKESIQEVVTLKQKNHALTNINGKKDARNLDTSRSSQRKEKITTSPSSVHFKQRLIQTRFGASSTCDVQRSGLIGGHISKSHEVERILTRGIDELHAELVAAAASAKSSGSVPIRIWPASGITRVCACLTNMYLHESDFDQVNHVIEAWLTCFIPQSKSAEKHEPISNIQSNQVIRSDWNRGKALVDGDGLPLARSDWTLVRILITTYFILKTLGNMIRVHSTKEHATQFTSESWDRLFTLEMGLRLRFDFDQTAPIEQKQWTTDETRNFVTSYGTYLNPEIAAEICIRRGFPKVLDMILDQVVSSSTMSSTCDTIINWIADNQIDESLQLLEESNSICLVLHVLDLLYKKAPTEAIDLSVRKYPILQPWNVQRCLFGTSVDFTLSKVKAEYQTRALTYLEYLIHLLSEKREIAVKEAPIVNQCISLCFADINATDRIIFMRYQESQSEWLQKLFYIPSINRDFDHAACWKLFEAHCEIDAMSMLVLRSLSFLSSAEQGIRELHQLMNHLLGSKSSAHQLYELIKRLGQFVSHKEVVNQALDLIATCTDIYQGSRPVDSSKLAVLILLATLETFGIQVGLQFLHRHPNMFRLLSYSDHKLIIEWFLLYEQEVNVLYQVLETVDAHVWLPKESTITTCPSIALPPHLAVIFDLEREAMQTPGYFELFRKWRQDSRALSPAQNALHFFDEFGDDDNDDLGSINQLDGGLQRLYDCQNGEWGGELQLHNSVCAMCDLPIVLIAEEDYCNVEISLLPCGHAYHASCLIDGSCSICMEAAFNF